MDGGQQVGDGDREAAVQALTEHVRAGRITSQEFEDRSLQVRAAVTRGDLAAALTGLPPSPAVPPGQPEYGTPPSPPPYGGPSRPSQVNQPPSVPPPLPPAPYGPAPYGPGSGDRDRVRKPTMAVLPIAAVLLFFITRQWWVFLLIPVIAIVLNNRRGR